MPSTITHPPVITCPSWCELLPGHPWRLVDEPDSTYRTHAAGFGPIVRVEQDETPTGIEAATTIEAYTPDLDGLTADAAERLARHLLAAATMLRTL